MDEQEKAAPANAPQSQPPANAPLAPILPPMNAPQAPASGGMRPPEYPMFQNQRPSAMPPPPPASPPPMQQPYYPVPAPIKQRRVGTFTLGLTLILIGVMIPFTMIFHEDVLVFLQFAPALLAVLGIEVLIYSFRYKEGKLKYDGVSIFLVIMLTLASLVASAVAVPMTNAAEYYRQVRDIRVDVEEDAREAISESGYSGEAYAYDHEGDKFWFYDRKSSADRDWQMSVRVELYGNDNTEVTKEQAAEMIWNVYSKLNFEKIYRISFEVSIDSEMNRELRCYSLDMSGRRLAEKSKADVEAALRTEKIYRDNTGYESSGNEIAG